MPGLGLPPERVKLAPEYEVDIPLWPRSVDTDALMSPDLLDRLGAWQDTFNSNFHHQTGWKDKDIRERWAEEARILIADIRECLPVGYVLDVDLWPLKPNDGP